MLDLEFHVHVHSNTYHSRVSVALLALEEHGVLGSALGTFFFGVWELYMPICQHKPLSRCLTIMMCMVHVLLLPPSGSPIAGTRQGSLALFRFDEVLAVALGRRFRVVDFERKTAIRRAFADRAGDLLAAEGAELGHDISTFYFYILHRGIGRTLKLGVTHRRILRNIVGVASRVLDVLTEGVSPDTGRVGGLAELAGAAGEHELVAQAIFLGIEHVGAAGTSAILDLDG